MTCKQGATENHPESLRQKRKTTGTPHPPMKSQTRQAKELLVMLKTLLLGINWAISEDSSESKRLRPYATRWST
ncbi:hypothetical protein ScPMuIL_001665 [Solemya velum]